MSAPIERELAGGEYLAIFTLSDDFPTGWANFVIYEIIGRQHNPDTDKFDLRRFQKRGSAWSPNFVPTFAEADVFANGFVKWDGCLEIGFNECEDGGRLHFCGPEDGRKFGAMVSELWAVASELLEAYEA